MSDFWRAFVLAFAIIFFLVAAWRDRLGKKLALACVAVGLALATFPQFYDAADHWLNTR